MATQMVTFMEPLSFPLVMEQGLLLDIPQRQSRSPALNLSVERVLNEVLGSGYSA